MRFSSLLGKPNPAQRERWERTKAKGKKRFILRTGVLQWGGFMFVAMTLSHIFRKPAFPRHLVDYIFDVVLNLLIWPSAGYLFGLSMWAFYESYFSNSTDG